MNKPNQNVGLWWTAITSLSLGLAVYILLKPENYNPDIERYRSMALVASFAIAGLCIIIATRQRWFGKGL